MTSLERVPASLQVTDLVSGYGKHTVLRGVSLTVTPGRITAVSGVNGAGKSTLLSTLSGLVPARGGTVTLGGRDVSRLSVPERVRAGVSHCPQGRRILQTLTVEENLALGAWTRTSTEAAEAHAWLYEVFPVLADKRHERGGALSGGQQQMLAIARSLMSSPSVLLVDEPSMGLAPAIVQQVYALLRTLVGMDIAVLLVEEHVRLLEDVADEILILSRGAFIAADSEDLREHPEDTARWVLGGDSPTSSHGER